MAEYRNQPYVSVMADMRDEDYRKRLMQQQALEGSYPETVIAPLGNMVVQGVKSVAPLMRSVFQTVERKDWPTVYNHVLGAEKVMPVGTKPNMLTGRPFTEADKVTYGYRNLSQKELDDLAKTGYLNPNPAAAFSKEGKWFSAGDEAGTFGRTWKNSPTNSTVRIPIENIPKTKAVSAKDVQILNKESNKYSPLSASYWEK